MLLTTEMVFECSGCSVRLSVPAHTPAQGRRELRSKGWLTRRGGLDYCPYCRHHHHRHANRQTKP